MRITKKQIKQIIKEEVARALCEGTLYISRSDYGVTVEDDNDNYISIGEMVLDLIDSGDTDIFQAPQGVDEKALQNLISKHEEGVQGGMQRWDSDVFGDYYSVDIERVLRLYARLKNHKLQETSEMRNEYEDDGTNEFESYYS